MRQFYTSKQMLDFISENEGNIGYFIGITDTINSIWSLVLYTGNFI